MLEAVINHFANGNKSQMARILDITPQAVSTWLLRNTFDQELIYAKCDGINPDWLLTGRGSMLKDEVMGEQAPISTLPAAEASVYYTMYKEERAKAESQAEQIGALKQTVRQLEEKIEGLQHKLITSDSGDARDAGIADAG